MAKKRPPRLSCKKINVTKNYRLFGQGDENRNLCMKKHKKLLDSMKKYGYLASFPIVCFRNGDKHLIVKDGQHRLAIAESIDLPVYWVEEEHDFDVATINNTAKVWGTIDYAEKYATNGLPDYVEGLKFASTHRLPIGTAFSLLAGQTCFGNISSAFKDGEYKVKDREYADVVASIYGAMIKISKDLKANNFLTACMAVCRIKAFQPNRLIQGAKKRREKLVSYST